VSIVHPDARLRRKGANMRSTQDLEARRPFIIRVPPEALARSLRRQLTPTADRRTPVIWSDGDAEIVVYPHQLRVSLEPGLVLIELPVATDQTGKDALVVPFSVGASADDATLLAMTESVPRGHPLLAARWGSPVQEALWQTLLQVGEARIAERSVDRTMTLSGLYADGEDVAYVITRPFTAMEISDYYESISTDDPPPRPPEPVEEPSRATGCLFILIALLRRAYNWAIRLARIRR